MYEELIKAGKELKELKELSNKLSKETTKVVDKIWKVEKKIEKFIFKNKLYLPIENLKEYEDGTDIKEITLISDKGEFKEFSDMEILEIRKGHVHASDYTEGIYEYDSEENKYFHYYHWSKDKGITIVGYVNFDLEKESYIENIVKRVAESNSDSLETAEKVKDCTTCAHFEIESVYGVCDEKGILENVVENCENWKDLANC